jgi:hypothetical protein
LSLKNPRDRVNSRTGFGTRTDFGSFSDTHPKGRKGGQRRRGIIGVVLVVCAVVAVLVAADYWANAGKIFQGVMVGSVAVGGETPEEARGMVEKRAADELGEIRFTGGPEEFALSAKDTNLNVDATGTVEHA